MTGIKRIVRIGVQVYSGLIGLVGIMELCIGVFFLIGMFRREVGIGMIAMVILAGGFGAVFLVVAVQAIFRYSERAVVNVAGITGFMIYIVVYDWARKTWREAWDGDNVKMQAVIIIAPIFAGLLAYKLLRRFLTRWTLEEVRRTMANINTMEKAELVQPAG